MEFTAVQSTIEPRRHCWRSGATGVPPKRMRREMVEEIQHGGAKLVQGRCSCSVWV